MKIKVAEHSGFCFGVREAIRKTEALIEKRTDKDERIYTCGPLIHNRAVTEDLSSRGVKIVGQLSLIPPASTIVIRSHGEPKSFHDEAARLNLSVVDATCPFVSKIHRLVSEA
ncbi:MAG: bifunctional 4-hydroxy-3-methylbut-2-enyl diphosphate reductase/30S ribosomal protein S1, partial [Anaerovoracaceae bacterium]